MKNELTVATGLLLVFSLSSCGRSPKSPKMNVIYILADDLGYGDLGCTGSTNIETPNLDRLRAEGMLFTQHYTGCTVSAPSRSSLLTGQHTGHTYIRGNKEYGDEGQEPLPAGTYTLGRMFQDAGYVTGAFGKWGLGYPGSEGEPTQQGFDEFFGYNCQRLAHRYYPAHLWHNSEKVVLEGNTDSQCGDYAPDLIHTQALRFIENNKDRPFFLFLPVVQPHAELLAPDDDLLRQYQGRFEERPFVGKQGSDYGPDMNPSLYCSQAEPYTHFAAMVGRLDRYVGEVMEVLKEHGLDQNTIVMFTSDNGPHREGGANPDYFASYGPYRGVKRDLYEGGIHLPLIAWAPGMIEADTECDHVCAMWDMMPTMAEIAGVKLTSPTDGISILPSLKGSGKQSTHDYLYWEFHESGGKIAVRKDNWKGIMLNVSIPEKSLFELYDLSKDIHEDRDLSPEHPAIVAELKEIMKRARTESPVFVFSTEKR